MGVEILKLRIYGEVFNNLDTDMKWRVTFLVPTIITTVPLNVL